MTTTRESSEKSQDFAVVVQEGTLDVAARLAAGGTGEISPDDALRIRYILKKPYNMDSR